MLTKKRFILKQNFHGVISLKRKVHFAGTNHKNTRNLRAFIHRIHPRFFLDFTEKAERCSDLSLRTCVAMDTGAAADELRSGIVNCCHCNIHKELFHRHVILSLAPG